MILVIEGLPYFGFPDKMKLFVQYVQEQDDSTLRIIGGISMLIGLVILFFARGGLTFL
jgi:uncharacterized protein YjeT (DUF2065 family)